MSSFRRVLSALFLAAFATLAGGPSFCLGQQDSQVSQDSQALEQATQDVGPRRSTDQWKDEMQRFRLQDQQTLHRDVVFTGSSSVRMWDLQASFGDQFQWINRGFGGSIINDNIVLMDRTVLPYSPKVVVLYAGDNDIGIEMSVEDVVADYRRFCEILHQQSPETRLVYIAIKPSLARWSMWPKMKQANREIQKLAEQSDWQWFGDIAAPMLGEDGKPMPELFQNDGLHMTAVGYEKWTEVLEPLIRQALAASETK